MALYSTLEDTNNIVGDDEPRTMLYTDRPQLRCRNPISNIPNPCQNNVSIPGMQSHSYGHA